MKINKRPENEWYFDWKTFSFNYHDTKSKRPAIFAEGSRANAAHKFFFDKIFPYLFGFIAISTLIYIVTFPWDTCYWTSDLIHDADGWSRSYDCTGDGLTLVDIFKWLVSHIFN